MKIRMTLAGLLLAGLCAWAAPAHAASDESAPAKTLRAFSSDEELAAFFTKELLPRWQAERKRLRERSDKVKEEAKASGVVMSAPPAPDEVTPSASEESVTNVQHAGVDEGGEDAVPADWSRFSLAALLRTRR